MLQNTDKQDFFSNIKGNYDKIKNLFIWKGKLLAIDNQNELYFSTRVLFVEYKTLWENWENNIIQKVPIEEFEYPIVVVWKDIKTSMNIDFFCRGGFIVLLSIVSLVSMENKINLSPNIFLFMFVFLSIPFFLERFSSKYSGFSKIYKKNNSLKIFFFNGDTRVLKLEDVKRYDLGADKHCAFLIFKDGTKLLHLERLNYWPILRKDLEKALNI